MMKIKHIVLCILLVFVGCQRDEEMEIGRVTVTGERIEASYSSVVISCNFQTNITIKNAKVYLSTTEDNFSSANAYPMIEDSKNSYSVKIEELTDASVYYFLYEISNRWESKVLYLISEFETLPCTIATITTSPAQDVTYCQAVVGGKIIENGGLSITQCGVVYSTSPTPTIEDGTKVDTQEKTDTFTCTLTNLTFSTTYYARAYAINDKGIAYGEDISFTTEVMQVSDSTGVENGHTYVDLGLPSGLMWATCNVGANTPVEYGDYFAWGETSPKEKYEWSTYKWCNGSGTTLTKYCTKSGSGENGFTDNKTILELSDDVAHVSWSGMWRMPTKAEQDELQNNCTWTWISQKDINGFKVTSKINGNSIFLPAAGHRYVTTNHYAGIRGNYWSSTLSTDESYMACEWLFISSSTGWNTFHRYNGVTVRPVLGESVPEIFLPVLTTHAIIQITETTAVAGGNVTADGNASVTERGVVYSTEQNPTTDNNKLASGSGTGEFTCNLTGLQANTTYYVRAYAVNSKGTAYGEQVSFTTKEQSSTPNNGTENGYAYVDLGLSVKWATCNVGANNPEDYGDYFAWGETTTKDTYNWSTYKWCNGSSSTLTKYCNNSSYGNNGFTDNKTQLELSDDAAHVNWGGSWRMPTDAEWSELINNCTWTWTIQNGVIGRKVTSKTNGNSIFLPHAGFRSGSSLSSAGTNGDYWSSLLAASDPSNAWSVLFGNGTVGRNDYRYYGQSVRPVLGENIVETTIPTVTTSAVTQITETSAVAGGNVTSDGNATVTERGVVYGIKQNPTTDDNKLSSGSGTGDFTCNLANLQPNTIYYVRAYAVNEKGTAYGEELNFTTSKQIALPTVTTSAVSQITETTAEAGGNVTSDGNATVTERGVVYSTKQNPTISDNKKLNGSGVGSFVCDLSNLQAGTTYYVRAYAINNKGTAYGDEVSFTTAVPITLATVTTASITNITETTAKAGGTVTNDGNASVTERGVVYSTNENPTIANNKLTNGSGAGSFTCNLTGLQENTTYYVRAYAVNSKGTAYGEQVSFTTSKTVVLPSVTTSTVTQITETTAVAGGNVTSDGNASVTERGVVYGKSPNPTISNLSNTIRPCGSGMGEFTYNMTDLQPSTTYYVRAYATNEVGTAYGEEVSFTTQEQSSTPNNGTENGYAYVDLGLSVKWATMNVGASSPEDYGDYFAWGETTPKDYYDWSTYKHCNGSATLLTKYNNSSSDGIVDNKTRLELSDDAARANWGGAWRMPTYAEMTELYEQCIWSWTTQNSVNGYKVTSKSNGNSIFLPAAGFRSGSSLSSAGSSGFYWSSSFSTDSDYPYYAWNVFFYSSYVGTTFRPRAEGFTVRPVWGEYVKDTVPTIITTTVTQITETSAVAGGNVTSDGGASMTERGVVYSINQNPTTADNKIPNGSGMGSFTCNLTSLQPNTTYYVRAYAVNSKGTAYGSQVSFTTKEQSSTPNNGTENGYAYVDLGLSVKWATMNVGASSPEDYGDYFAWGETTTKDTYDWSTYKYCNGSSSTLTKYCNNSSYGNFGNNGFTDNKTQLELSDDAARANWGGSWRMPTVAEWTELREQCTWTWTIQNGVYGRNVTSKTNGNSIFLPVAGCRYDSLIDSAGRYGYYWSSSLITDYPSNAWGVYFNSGGVDRSDKYRYYGQSVRPVCP